MRGKKIGVLLFFFLVIYLPLAVNLLRIHTNTVLTGVAQGSDYKRPSFSYASFLSGAYQKQFDDWYNNNFGMRTDVIKLYNQFRYSVFSQASSVVVGKEKELYENTYISYHYVTDPKYDYSKEYMDKLINDLSALQQIMDDNNKEFMVLITPSKTTFYPGDIPSSYQQEAIPGGENYYPEFAQALGSSGINYTDCVELMKDNPPVAGPYFYKTGTHWTYLTAGGMANFMIDSLNRIYGSGLPPIKIADIQQSDKPAYPVDMDLYGLLNIYSAPPKQAYYSAKFVSGAPDGSAAESRDVLWQGGSFSNIILQIFSDSGVFNTADEVFYKESCTQYPLKNNFPLPNGFDSYDFMRSLGEKDLFVLEVNEEQIQAMDDRVTYFLDVLRQNGDTIPEIQYLTAFNASDVYNNQFLTGFYANEGDFRWTKGEAALVLKDPLIAAEGLSLDFKTAANMLKPANPGKELYADIYVNDKKCLSVPLSDNSEALHYIAPDALPEAADGIYRIRIESPTFNPYQLGTSGDNRDLGLSIKYIGRAGE